MNCLEAQKLMSPYLDQTLPDQDLCAFLDHLDDCEACRKELEITMTIYHVLGDSEEIEEYDFQSLLSSELRESRRYLRIKKWWNYASRAGLLIMIAAVLSSFGYLFYASRVQSGKQTDGNEKSLETQTESTTEGSSEGENVGT